MKNTIWKKLIFVICLLLIICLTAGTINIVKGSSNNESEEDIPERHICIGQRYHVAITGNTCPVSGSSSNTSVVILSYRIVSGERPGGYINALDGEVIGVGLGRAIVSLQGNSFVKTLFIVEDHEYNVDPTSEVAATCETEGKTAGQKCSRCGAVIKGEVIPALGHDMFLHKAMEATYEAEGNSAYWECKRCGHFFSDAEGENEIAEGSWVTPKLIPDGWVTIAGEKYYYKDRAAQKGWLSYEGGWYYLDPTTGAMQTGFVKVGSSTYYMAESGIMQTGWFKDGDIWYYANGSGVLQTGWLKSGSTWYYLDPATGTMQTGFVTIGSTKYYMAASGAMQTGWIKDDGTWYYANGSGAIQKGWVQSGPTWYYMDPTTGEIQTGWVTIGSTKYYMASSGAMVTGWVKVDDDWYFMNSSGAMQTGWVKSGNSWYYMKSNGVMAANEWVAGYYWINASGTWTYQPVGSWKQNSTGWWFGDTSGWYAKNETLIIAGVEYTFNAKGYMVEQH